MQRVLTESTGSRALSPIRRPRTTADEVEERLIIAIARGDKASGERITEAEIASALQVSRVPAREAMQKLQVRGILVGGHKRGLRVSDYSRRRIAELFELRFAIEKIIIQHVMRRDHDRTDLLEELEGILARMAELSDSGDPVKLSSVDLDFHRAIAKHSGAELATQMWDGLAQHLIIVFCRDWSKASDRPGEVRLHRKMVDFFRSGAIADIDAVLTDHFSEPSLGKGARRRRRAS
jgi:GntR family transcriptional regulator, rspAB operon transcriptional repressor